MQTLKRLFAVPEQQADSDVSNGPPPVVPLIQRPVQTSEQPATLDPRDLQVLGVIGAGSFGLVHIARHVKTNAPIALKQINKAKILDGRHLPHVLSERHILASVHSPFMVNMVGTFQDDHFLYIAMEFVPGGEFFTYLVMVGTLPEDHCRLYAAQILLALEALHERQVAFRDLKPENVLIAADGYLKLTDLGFAKIVPEKTFTLCGTPEYTSPETIMGTGHGITSDWWSLGILIYEMLMARAPFQDDDLSMLYAKILRGQYIEPPPTVASPTCKDALRRLLTVDPAKRLGAQGPAEIRRHPWFAVLDWTALREKKFIMPYVPAIRGPFDASNFEPVDPANPLLRPPNVVLTPQQQALFQGF